MANDVKPEPIVIVIFGAAGDLAWRKLAPALYHLDLDRHLPDPAAVLGVDAKAMDDDALRKRLRDGVETFSPRKSVDGAAWEAFARRLSYLTGDLQDPAAYNAVARRLLAQDKAWGLRAQRMFYCATPPAAIGPIAEGLGSSGLAHDCERTRIVVEKPFGRDLASARKLNAVLGGVFRESQIYRIDHYLGKETVQNLLALRFANAVFEPIWDRRYIDHVQITVAEDLGVEHRGPYYERAGALRDMIQSHLMQILCLIGMEPMITFDPDEIRNKKVDVLRAVRPIAEAGVAEAAVRGQYGAGWMRGRHVPAYRSEPGVNPQSEMETFAAVKLFIDNWRWQDVPFYLRTGKRLPARVSEVVIQFRPVPHLAFSAMAAAAWQPNRLIVRIQPNEGLLLRLQAKRPGLTMNLGPVDVSFLYRDAFQTEPKEAYETLLLDAMRGDASLFMRADQVEAAWALVEPILTVWGQVPPIDFPNYPAGTWGPEAAEALIARDGRTWFPTSVNADEAEGEAER
jgi:glucose-6-phosphate 1-dehydrogenase